MMGERPKRPNTTVPMFIWWDMGEGPQAPRFQSLELSSLELVARFLACLPEHVYQWLIGNWSDEALYFSGPPNTGASSWLCEGRERITHLVLGAELLTMPERAAVAAIAHEIAHLWLGHHRKTDSQQFEQGWEEADAEDRAADALAKSWGFDVPGHRE